MVVVQGALRVLRLPTRPPLPAAAPARATEARGARKAGAAAPRAAGAEDGGGAGLAAAAPAAGGRCGWRRGACGRACTAPGRRRECVWYWTGCLPYAVLLQFCLLPAMMVSVLQLIYVSKSIMNKHPPLAQQCEQGVHYDSHTCCLGCTLCLLCRRRCMTSWPSGGQMRRPSARSAVEGTRVSPGANIPDRRALAAAARERQCWGCVLGRLMLWGGLQLAAAGPGWGYSCGFDRSLALAIAPTMWF